MSPAARPAGPRRTTTPANKILIVKLSSLGDVVHAMPALQDIRAAFPFAQIDWVVERAFAPLAARCSGVRCVIACDIRSWRKAPLGPDTREQWAAFRAELQQQPYDAIIDLQGLAKSALIARLARLAKGGKRFALGNRTEGAGYEAPTRWVADVVVPVEPRIHAVERSRVLCARALGYAHDRKTPPVFGLQVNPVNDLKVPPRIAFVHGTSRVDKQWPLEHWIALGERLNGAGWRVALIHGSDTEQRRSAAIAARLADAEVWPRMRLDLLCDALGSCAGVVGVDSGLSHIAVALGLPHVQLYNFETAWRTGPSTPASGHAVVYARPTPGLEPVWRACRQVLSAAGNADAAESATATPAR